MREVDFDRPWAARGRHGGENKRISSTMYYIENFDSYIKAKYDDMVAGEQRWEAVRVEDADVVLVAYGISSRICKEAVMQARERGIRLGLLRPISLWPFPVKGFAEVNPEVKAYLAVELSALPRLEEDVRLVAGQRVPPRSRSSRNSLAAYGSGGGVKLAGRNMASRTCITSVLNCSKEQRRQSHG